MRLDGETAIVTGGAKGIGLAIARRLATEGARVVIADIETEAGKEAAEDLSAIGTATFVEADVSERLDVHNLVTGVTNNFGPIGILINNAGIGHSAPFLDLAEDDFDRVLRINLKSAFLCGQAVARHMVDTVKQGGKAGRIVNMSSINDSLAIADQLPYCVSKGGVKQLTRVMAVALAPHGIRVNGIGPGSIQTEMLAPIENDEDMRRMVLSRTPLGRVGDPAEIAAVAAFLASEDSSYLTGQIIYADGGRLPLNHTMPTGA
ncbi:SDR family NAD(P)-dependent oxidoreductase [Pseudohoeflea coraliihabitans]|uniref:SDR family oxidoreductase n=1 Tax=Pseudohoeflea coraliihabitans TaxID=2860393 RepID=A0ABS6WT77_9HYPH|nr:SDR family oxidoreductase [Pseudohoeflea sp. DP4N28-3]MBW3099151.1 SDR family oxidoreductase [Pseudohoeflea sp. DP4N28-3]